MPLLHSSFCAFFHHSESYNHEKLTNSECYLRQITFRQSKRRNLFCKINIQFHFNNRYCTKSSGMKLLRAWKSSDPVQSRQPTLWRSTFPITYVFLTTLYITHNDYATFLAWASLSKPGTERCTNIINNLQRCQKYKENCNISCPWAS